MKTNRLLYLIIIVLLIWNVCLTITLSDVSKNSEKSETTIVNRTVNGYSTDLTATAETIKTSNVTIETNNSVGSGFIYSTDENSIYIVSAYHVVSDSSLINVLFANGLSLEGTVVNYDIYDDLVLISVTKTVEVTPATLGDASLLKAGEFILAVGTPDNIELSMSLTLGMVSSPLQTITNTIKVDGVSYEYYLDDIQLSSLMANGYSGSAVYNQGGEVVGVITMSMDDKEIFATPVNEVKRFVENVLSEEPKETVPLNIKGEFIKELEVYAKNYYGLNLEDNDGYYVEDVKLNSVFKDTGLKKGDIILSVNGLPLDNYEDMENIRYSDLNELTLEVIRENETLTLQKANND